MANVIDVAARFKAISIEAMAANIVKANPVRYPRLNQNQLLDGEDHKGSQIKPDYKSIQYARFKNKKNQRAGLGTPDLHVTGKLYRGIKPNFSGIKINFTNTDSKANLPQIKQYGNDLWGLQEQNVLTIQKQNTEEFIKQIKQATGL